MLTRMQKYTSCTCVLCQIRRKICSDAYAHVKNTFCSVCVLWEITRETRPDPYAHAKNIFLRCVYVWVCALWEITRKICPHRCTHSKTYFFGVCTLGNHTRDLLQSIRALKKQTFPAVYICKNHKQLLLWSKHALKIFFYLAACLLGQITQVGNSPSIPYKGIRTHITHAKHMHHMHTRPSPKFPLYSLQWEYANFTLHQNLLLLASSSLPPHIIQSISAQKAIVIRFIVV